MNRLLLSFALILGLTFISSNAGATSCWRPTPSEHVEATGMIFYGKVAGGSGGPADNQMRTAELEVLRAYKGTPGKTVKVRYYNDHGALRGWGFQPGQSVLVFADVNPDGTGDEALPRVGYCSMIPYHARSNLHAGYQDVLERLVAGTGPGTVVGTDAPQFGDFSTAIYSGPVSAPDLSSHPDARTYRTRLRDAAKGKVNFAGEYILTTWGCGTSCLMGAAINARSGKVHFLPGSVCCWLELGEEINPIDSRADSSLIVLTGAVNEAESLATHYYEFRGGQFRFLQKQAVAVNPAPPATPETAGEVTLTPRIIDAGKWVEGMAYDGRWLWAAESGQRTVARIDLQSGRVSKRIKVGRLPTGMLSSQDGTVFALVATDHMVWRRNKRGRNKKLVWLKGCPEKMVEDGRNLWVLTLPDCSSRASRVVRVNPKSGKKAGSPVLGEWAQALAAHGDQIWVGHARGPALSILDKTSLQPQTVTIPGTEVWTMTSNGRNVFTGGRLDGTSSDGLVIKIDPSTKAEVARASLPEMVMKVTSDETHVVAVGEKGTIWVFSESGLKLLRTITVSTGPYRAGSIMLHEDNLLVAASTHKGDNGAVFVLSDWRP